MQITAPPPDATVERSRSTFLSRWLVLRWQVLRGEKTGGNREDIRVKEEMHRYAYVDIFTLLFFSLGILRVATWTNKNESRSFEDTLDLGFAMFRFFLPEIELCSTF